MSVENIDYVDLIENPKAIPTPGQYVRVREGSGVVIKTWHPLIDNTNEVKYSEFLAEREKLFVETNWVRERHSDRVELGIDDTENWRMWLDYWESLRNLPNSKDFSPIDIIWPQKPK